MSAADAGGLGHSPKPNDTDALVSAHEDHPNSKIHGKTISIFLPIGTARGPIHCVTDDTPKVNVDGIIYYIIITEDKAVAVPIVDSSTDGPPPEYPVMIED